MPIFRYHCQKCGKKFDLFQRITDDPLKICSYCGGRAQRVEEPLSPPAQPSVAPRVARKKTAPRKKRAAKKVVHRRRTTFRASPLKKK